MASQGPNSPGTVVTDSSIGSADWSNPGNAAANDGSSATCTLVDEGEGLGNSYYLVAKNFGFSIPVEATINGIVVSYKASGSTSSRIAVLVKADILQTGGDDNGGNMVWDNSLHTVGGSNDLWGSAWTPSDVNDAGFGVAVNGVGNPTVLLSIDFLGITVYYTVPATGKPTHAMHQFRQRRS